ncbi:MAG: nucleotidyltransferase domain-containing protein, partial [Clostridia bacterium]|nr:nucleotidyltransferase domain-containing protein [Clostridia bacterium]
MIDIKTYISDLIVLLRQTFGERLTYVGLQGSYLRGEATDDSDIDIMVIIEKLSPADMDAYRTIIRSLGHYDKSCGFICSKTDMAHWNPLEIWHVLNGTKDLYGVLAELIPEYTENDIR